MEYKDKDNAANERKTRKSAERDCESKRKKRKSHESSPKNKCKDHKYQQIDSREHRSKDHRNRKRSRSRSRFAESKEISKKGERKVSTNGTVR